MRFSPSLQSVIRTLEPAYSYDYLIEEFNKLSNRNDGLILSAETYEQSVVVTDEDCLRNMSPEDGVFDCNTTVDRTFYRVIVKRGYQEVARISNDDLHSPMDTPSELLIERLNRLG